MSYREFPPRPELSRFIQLITIWEAESSKIIAPPERILPDGIVELVIHYGDPFAMTDIHGKTALQPRSFALSQMRHFVDIQPIGKVGLITVGFYPWGAYHFFSVPIRDFVDKAIPIDCLWQRGYAELEEQICLATNATERVALIQQFLNHKLKRHYTGNDHTDIVIRYIRQTRGLISIKTLCTEIGISKKQLERNVVKCVGSPPKLLSRITRFLHICRRMRERGNGTLTELTYECGYYDQAHFIKEFTEFSGFRPKECFDNGRKVSFSNL